MLIIYIFKIFENIFNSITIRILVLSANLRLVLMDQPIEKTVHP